MVKADRVCPVGLCRVRGQLVPCPVTQSGSLPDSQTTSMTHLSSVAMLKAVPVQLPSLTVSLTLARMLLGLAP